MSRKRAHEGPQLTKDNFKDEDEDTGGNVAEDGMVWIVFFVVVAVLLT